MLLMRLAQLAVVGGSLCNSAVWWLEVRDRTKEYVV